MRLLDGTTIVYTVKDLRVALADPALNDDSLVIIQEECEPEGIFAPVNIVMAKTVFVGTNDQTRIITLPAETKSCERALFIGFKQPEGE